MHRITLTIILLFAATTVDAAWYHTKYDTIVDPIQSVTGGDLSYHGINLEPVNASLSNANLSGAFLHDAALVDADLTGADLSAADLSGAWLHGANLSHADLSNANLSHASLTGADFSHANLSSANFTGALDPPSTSSQLTLTPLEETIIGGAQLDEAIFAGADLSGAVFDHENDAYDATGWETATWTGASFHYLKPALFPTGMIHTDHGIVVRTPEPSTLLLALIGLALVPRRRRRTVAIKTLTTLKTV